MKCMLGKLWVFVTVLFLVSVVTACASDTNNTLTNNQGNETNESGINNNAGDEGGVNNNGANENAAIDINPDEDVTLIVAVPWEEDMFNERFRDPIAEAYPTITLEQLQTPHNPTAADLEELFLAGHNPDIMFHVPIPDLIDLELDFDLDERIDAHNYDISHIIPELIENARATDPQGRLLTLPYETEPDALLYNKDVFDMFGVEYPQVGMTWDEMITRARALTMEDGGVEYRGVDFILTENIPQRQFSINETDPETGEVLLLEKPEFTRSLELFDQIASIPGLYDEETYMEWGGTFDKWGNGETAMLLTRAQALDWSNEERSLNIDATSIPVWEDMPETGPRLASINLSINPHSAYIDEAFRVITHFTEEEYQSYSVRKGLPPVTNVADIQHQFLADLIDIENYDIESIFAHSPASPPEQISRYNRFAHVSWHDFAQGSADPVEYLRERAEEAAVEIEEERMRE